MPDDALGPHHEQCTDGGIDRDQIREDVLTWWLVVKVLFGILAVLALLAGLFYAILFWPQLVLSAVGASEEAAAVATVLWWVLAPLAYFFRLFVRRYTK